MKSGSLMYFILMFFIGINVSAQKFIKCEISNDTVLLGNSLELSYLAENFQAEFEGPEMLNIPVFAGPHMSRTMSIINGKTASLSTFSYHIKPDKIGVITIPPAYFKKDNQIFELPPFEIVIMPNPNNLVQNHYRKEEVFSMVVEPDNGVNSNIKNKTKKRL